MRIFIETYGSNFNLVTSEIMAAILVNKGHKLAKEEDAELIIVNSYAQSWETERKVLKRLGELKDAGKHVIITGELPEIAKEKIEETNPNVSIVGLSSLTYIAEVIDKMQEGKQIVRMDDKPRSLANLARIRINPLVGNILISEGSSDNSIYSLQRIIYGSLISYSPDAVIKDVMHALEKGAKEINLTSLDTASYGLDSGIRLPSLLRKMHTISGNFKVSIDKMHPKNAMPIMDDLLLAFNSPKIYQHLHLGIESGSNNVLRAMKIGHTAEEVKLLVAAFKRKYPNVSISTDVSVGLPGESDEDFNMTLELIKELKPDELNVYPYSPRNGTEAAKMQQIPSWKIKSRVLELEEFAKKNAAEKNKSWLGWEGDVLVTEKTPLGCLARNFAYKPIYLQYAVPGENVKVKIVEAKDDHLVGQVAR